MKHNISSKLQKPTNPKKILNSVWVWHLYSFKSWGHVTRQIWSVYKEFFT